MEETLTRLKWAPLQPARRQHATRALVNQLPLTDATAAFAFSVLDSVNEVAFGLPKRAVRRSPAEQAAGAERDQRVGQEAKETSE